MFIGLRFVGQVEHWLCWPVLFRRSDIKRPRAVRLGLQWWLCRKPTQLFSFHFSSVWGLAAKGKKINRHAQSKKKPEWPTATAFTTLTRADRKSTGNWRKLAYWFSSLIYLFVRLICCGKMHSYAVSSKLKEIMCIWLTKLQSCPITFGRV